MSFSSSQLTARRVAALRGNAMGGLVMVLVEYGLGISANLYATLPAADKGKTLFAALGAAVGNGPVVVSLHASWGRCCCSRRSPRSCEPRAWVSGA